MQEVTLTDEQVAAINAARSALRAVSIDANTPEEGRLVAVVEVAEEALFKVLNFAQSYDVVALTDEQVHNRA